MILTIDHLLQANKSNLSNLKIGNIDRICCFHTTRLRSIDCILNDGLRLPSEEGLSKLLADVGIDDVDPVKLKAVLDANGRNMFVHLNRLFLIKYCHYHRKGSERARKYIAKTCPDRLAEIEARFSKEFKGYILELLLPVEFFDQTALKKCFDDPDEHLLDHAPTADITLEVVQDVPPEYIKRHWDEDDFNA